MFESLRLIVKERAKCTAERNHRYRGRRLKAGNHADQIAKQNKEKQRGEKRRVAFTVVSDDFAALALNKSFNAFKDVLQRAGTVDRETRANEQEKNQQENEDQKLHRERI